MTQQQVMRAYRELWKRVTAGDGYQPFGHDERTMMITHPGFFVARDRLKREFERNTDN